MATAWNELQAEKPKQAHRPELWLERMLAAEQTDRQLKSLRYQLKSARFPIHRDLLGIDWNETPLAQALLEQLATAAFMETAHNLILVGGTGTGKTHLATAIGVAAIHQSKRVRFFNAVDLVNLLEREKALGKVGNLAKQLCLVDAVILDELGYARQTHRAREKLFIDYAGPTVAHPPQLRHIFVAAWAPPVMPVPT